jgi:histidine phosphotransferase ChpT
MDAQRMKQAGLGATRAWCCAPAFTLVCSGPHARIPPAFEKLVPGNIDGVPVDAHAVQPYYAGLLARACGMSVSARMDGEDVVIAAQANA